MIYVSKGSHKSNHLLQVPSREIGDYFLTVIFIEFLPFKKPDFLTSVMKDKTIKLTIRFPRTRISDSTRLFFPPESKPGWYPIGTFQELQPSFEIPKEILNGNYYIDLVENESVLKIDFNKYRTYDDVVRYILDEIRKSSVWCDNDLENYYLYGIQIYKNRTAKLLIEYINYKENYEQSFI